MWSTSSRRSGFIELHPRFSLSPSGDYDFFIGSETYQVGCFSWYNDDLLDGIAAAVVADLTGKTSIDRIKKQISGYRGLRSDNDAPAKVTLHELEAHLIRSYDALKPRVNSTIAEVVFDQAIGRVLTTLKNVLYLARRGYIFETAMVARGALEQIAWARGASRVVEENELFQIDIHKEITYLKAVYPSAGRLYGELSKYSHFDAKLHALFYAEKNGEVAVRRSDRGTKFMSMHWPFKISDIFLVVFEEFYRLKLPNLRAFTKRGKLKERRFTILNMNLYFKDVSDDQFEDLFC